MNKNLFNFARIARKYFSEDYEDYKVRFTTVSKRPDGKQEIMKWAKKTLKPVMIL